MSENKTITSDDQDFACDPNSLDELALLDLEAARDKVREDLCFQYEPTADHPTDRPFTFSAEEWRGTPMQAIGAELVRAAWERSGVGLGEETLRTDMRSFTNFRAFLQDLQEIPVNLASIDRDLLSMYDGWLQRQPVIVGLRTHQILTNLRSLASDWKCGVSIPPTVPAGLRARGNSGRRLGVNEISALVGTAPAALYVTPGARNILNEIADDLGLERLSASTNYTKHLDKCAKLDLKEADVCRPRSASNSYKNYNGITKHLKFLFKFQPELFSIDFSVPTFSEVNVLSGPVKTEAYPPNEATMLEKSSLQAIKEGIHRIDVEAPALIAAGDAALGQRAPKGWGQKIENILAYIATALGGRYETHRNLALNHARLTDGTNARRHFGGHLGTYAYFHPTLDFVTAVLIRMMLAPEWPGNLESVLGLEVDCLKSQGVPGSMAVEYDKRRANKIGALAPVPDRGGLDIPGLIRTMLRLTIPIRMQAPEAIKHFLFLYVDYQGVKHLGSDTANVAIKRHSIVWGLLDADGQPLSDVQFRRFRPTVIADIGLSAGLDQARAIAAHANPTQTLDYIGNPTSAPRVGEIARAAQVNAFRSIQAGFALRPAVAEVEMLMLEIKIPRGHATEMLMGERDKLYAACVNDKDSPQPGQRSGEVCEALDDCAVCKNALIFQRHLGRYVVHYLYWRTQFKELPPDEWKRRFELKCFIAEEHFKNFDPVLIERLLGEAEENPILLGSWKVRRT